jgi:hypothetical protein
MIDKQLLSDFLDNEVDAHKLDQAMEAARNHAEARDALTIYQLIKDSVAGVHAFDDGYSQRIFARLWPDTPSGNIPASPHQRA